MNDQQRAAMQMALEALDYIDANGHIYATAVLDAITALRESLTQSTNSYQNSTKLVETQPQDEWVDLTDDEIDEIESKILMAGGEHNDIYRAVIAADRELNK